MNCSGTLKLFKLFLKLMLKCIPFYTFKTKKIFVDKPEKNNIMVSQSVTQCHTVSQSITLVCRGTPVEKLT